jgi:hypothetical protein
MSKILKSSLLVALAAISGTAAAQTYQQYPSQYGQSNSAQNVLVQVLQSVLGNNTTSYPQYSDRDAMFARADLNHDGRLSQYEIDTFRARLRYEQSHSRNRWDRGIAVSRVDTNRDGYISRDEQRAFIQMIQQNGQYNDRYDNNDDRYDNGYDNGYHR